MCHSFTGRNVGNNYSIIILLRICGIGDTDALEKRVENYNNYKFVSLWLALYIFIYLPESAPERHYVFNDCRYYESYNK